MNCAEERGGEESRKEARKKHCDCLDRSSRTHRLAATSQLSLNRHEGQEERLKKGARQEDDFSHGLVSVKETHLW